ncbi:unnamed protein product [Arabidopsis halleri]
MVWNLFGAYSNRGESANKRQLLTYSPAELAATEVRAMELGSCFSDLQKPFSYSNSQHHVARLVQELDANLKQALVYLTFHQLVCSEEDGRGTVDYISPRLREGCPSYFKESDYKFYLAVERLERAALTFDAEEKENVAREAFSFLSKVPGSADLQKRFEKAQALAPGGDAFNDQLDASIREHALAQRKQCYEIIANALRSLASPMEYLYKAMIELRLENELLEYGGPDLVPFCQNAGSHSESQVGAVSAGSSPRGHSGTQISSDQAKNFGLLSKYYVSNRQHVFAAHVLLRLAERRAISSGDSPTLERSGLLDLLEGKLAVLQFQINIRDKLEAIASNFESSVAMQDSDQNRPVLNGDSSDDSSLANEMAMEVSSERTQLYNECKERKCI